MLDPFAILELPTESDDATIRRRYLELIKQFSPEHHPEKFSKIREAYEAIRTAESRVHFRLFEKGQNDTIEAIIEELACQTPRRRLKLKDLFQATTPR